MKHTIRGKKIKIDRKKLLWNRNPNLNHNYYQIHLYDVGQISISQKYIIIYTSEAMNKKIHIKNPGKCDLIIYTTSFTVLGHDIPKSKELQTF